MEMLITLLIWIIVFAVAAFGLSWICTRFFSEFPPARWICGAVLLIAILLLIAQQFGGGGSFPHFRT
jgi:uncharacterized phage infection (PIP) family protein YhgE